MGFVGKSEYFENYPGSLKDKFFKLLENTFNNEIHNNAELVTEPIEIKNYSTAVKKLYGKGYVLTGNSAEFIDPIFSSGVKVFSSFGSSLSFNFLFSEFS